jgi:hypothetical protein
MVVTNPGDSFARDGRHELRDRTDRLDESILPSYLNGVRTKVLIPARAHRRRADMGREEVQKRLDRHDGGR